MLGQIIYLVFFCLELYSVYYRTVIVEQNPLIEYVHTFAGRWKFLTWWNQVFQTFYFGVCVLNNLIGSNVGPNGQEKPSALQRLRDKFHATVAWPMGAFVVITFWSIYVVDRELVYPRKLDAIIPTWLNHIMHTTVLPFLLMDKALVYHHYPGKRIGMFTAVAVGAAYNIWIFWIAYHANIWVYPVLEIMNWPLRIVFMSLLWTFLIMLYLTGERITRVMWGQVQKVKRTKAKKVE